MNKALNFKKVCLFLLCAISMVTCTKDFNFASNEIEPKLIINCTFNVNKRFNVKLKTSRNILDPNSKNESVSDAYVAIKDGEGKLIEVLTESNRLGIYKSSSKLTAFPGRRYSLEVTHPNWPETVFTATSSVPLLGNDSVLDTNTILLSDGPAMEISALIDDGMDMGEKYIFQIELPNGELAPLSGYGSDVQVYGDRNVARRLFIQDENFNGQKKSLDFLSKKSLDEANGNQTSVIRMVNASPELYEYYKSLEEYNLAQSSIGSANTSAVRVYSNIKQSGINKGFGIFAGYNSKYLEVKR
ncbi:DUF4249 family protein [Portibacter marinus]|uniref:DUF4249 family protein n=1 Tax=Portibacter marinus TaxID=2898660 RepID=UPI001F226A36|nr:DUF4249 family protein [Portibacter marinus]